MLNHQFPRYHDHGDTIAIQYGGSHLVNTMETYRKINQWTSHSRDMVESFKRYYNNSFLDRQRQEAYNLFLGNYIFAQGQPMLWDLSTDYYLHHANPKAWSAKARKSYVNWYDPKHFERQVGIRAPRPGKFILRKPIHWFDDYWLEYYRPLALSSFQKIFSFRLKSTLQYIPFKLTLEGKYDLSPFRVRIGHEQESSDKGRLRKEAATDDPKNDEFGNDSLKAPFRNSHLKVPALPDWSDSQLRGQSPSKHNLPRDPSNKTTNFATNSSRTPMKEKTPKDQSAIPQWTLDQLVDQSLNPSVAGTEADEYQRYINHPLNLPLVTSTDEPPPHSNIDLLAYVSSDALDAIITMHSSDDDIADYVEFLHIVDDPLTVTEADTPKKRYKAYRQWLKGKSLFKQQRVDP